MGLPAVRGRETPKLFILSLSEYSKVRKVRWMGAELLGCFEVETTKKKPNNLQQWLIPSPRNGNMFQHPLS
jgi:hypothetical protein